MNIKDWLILRQNLLLIPNINNIENNKNRKHLNKLIRQDNAREANLDKIMNELMVSLIIILFN